MAKIKVAGAALNQTPLDWDTNQQNIINAIEQARKEDVSILCLPELCISGYGCEDAFFAKNTVQRSIDSLLQIVPFTKDMLVAVGLPLYNNLQLYNCCCLIADRKIIGFVAKQFLCNSGIHYEPRWFSAWPQFKVSEVLIDRQIYPFGDLCFKFDNLTLGVEICEDAWVADRPAKRLEKSGVNLILNLSASHFAFAKFETRKNIVKESSRNFKCAYLYTNLLGNESGRAIYDAGTLIADNGELLACGQRLSFKDVLLTSAYLEIKDNKIPDTSETKVKTIEPAFRLKISEKNTAEKNQSQQNTQIAEWEKSSQLKNEEFTRAVSMALFDYLRKSKSKGYVLSLSGGADSATIACLVRFSLALALAELGAEGLANKLRFINKSWGLDEIIKSTLLTVYQASANSSEITRNAAEQVAKAVNAQHHEINVSSIIDQYRKLIEESIGRQLSWQNDDLTLQNIQARARAPAAWMFANIRNSLLLATSNRSEVAVGYATMDGDTAGSISPIAGVDKDFIRKWLLWVEEQGPLGLGAVAALKYVNQQQPTAELRPADRHQTDEADLMPYDVLEFIERSAIRDKKSPQDILDLLRTQFPEGQKTEYLRWVKLFFILFSRSQWKRERYAPSFHLDDESLDPKTWCRYPILSGGFSKELEELK